MTPGERLDIIKALKPILLEMTTADAFLHVSEFTTNHTESWDYWQGGQDVEAWCVWLLRQLDGDELVRIHDYLLTAQPTIDDSKLPWRDGEFRLFLSHIAKEKRFLSLLAQALERYGIDGFVAHEHIEPGQEWTEVIRSSLFTCEALVAVLHPGFHESNWTDQEVGFVMGQNKFAVAVRLGRDPYGFIGAVQGIPAPPQFFQPVENLEGAAHVLARDIVKVLVAETRTQHTIRDALVNRLVGSRSFDMSNDIVDFLRQCPKISKDQYQRLRVAQKANDQVRNAYNMPAFLGDLADEYDDLPRPGPMEDEPF